MSHNPFDVVRQFESALCKYTGAPYCVTTTSCTSALMLAVAWHLRQQRWLAMEADMLVHFLGSLPVKIPKRTYVGVAHAILNAGGRPTYREEEWRGEYQLKPLPVVDSARWLRSGMYRAGQMMCLSFHHTKHLGLAAHGGAILHDNAEADAWLRRARFDGRTEGVAPKDDKFQAPAWHCYMTPATAAEGLMRLAVLPKHNDPLPWGPGTNSDYPDLSLQEAFK